MYRNTVGVVVSADILDTQGEESTQVPLPIMDEPLKRIAVDIVGPLPCSSSGKRCILVICDYTTRFPEVVALFNPGFDFDDSLFPPPVREKQLLTRLQKRAAWREHATQDATVTPPVTSQSLDLTAEQLRKQQQWDHTLAAAWIVAEVGAAQSQAKDFSIGTDYYTAVARNPVMMPLPKSTSCSHQCNVVRR